MIFFKFWYTCGTLLIKLFGYLVYNLEYFGIFYSAKLGNPVRNSTNYNLVCSALEIRYPYGN